jgi:hypothetical protein
MPCNKGKNSKGYKIMRILSINPYSEITKKTGIKYKMENNDQNVNFSGAPNFSSKSGNKFTRYIKNLFKSASEETVPHSILKESGPVIAEPIIPETPRLRLLKRLEEIETLYKDEKNSEIYGEKEQNKIDETREYIKNKVLNHGEEKRIMDVFDALERFLKTGERDVRYEHPFIRAVKQGIEALEEEDMY